jgi:hypothetical protein
LKAPTLLIIGRVVGLAKSLSWFASAVNGDEEAHG